MRLTCGVRRPKQIIKSHWKQSYRRRRHSQRQLGDPRARCCVDDLEDLRDKLHEQVDDALVPVIHNGSEEAKGVRLGAEVRGELVSAGDELRAQGSERRVSAFHEDVSLVFFNRVTKGGKGGPRWLASDWKAKTVPYLALVDRTDGENLDQVRLVAARRLEPVSGQIAQHMASLKHNGQFD